MRKFGIIGFPLGHSFSKKYFTDKFEKESINAAYKTYEISDLRVLKSILENEPELEGLNVTLPYKKDILNFLDYTGDQAAAIGAVNVIKVSQRKGSRFLSGYNTDILGFKSSVSRKLRMGDRGAIILGTGGAALAVAEAFRELDIRVSFVSRTGDENTLRYRDLDKKQFLDNSIIVNATPLGMYPDTNYCPDIPYDLLTADHLLYDLVYNPADTLFLKKGAEKGTRVSGGMEMLLGQAEEAWKIWNSKEFI